jgi:outer membrane receptor protein involved in Fe transport
LLFILRFADARSNFLRDGLPDPAARGVVELPNIERIEVLKGSASVLYGFGNPGGTINLVTKKPLRDSDLSDRLSATLAFYELTRTNVLIDDPNNPGFSIQTGEQRSRGIDLNIGGEILPGWNIIAGYAYTDAQITEDEDAELVGNQLNNTPENAFNLWTTYEIQTGGLQGLGFGLGYSL